MDEPSAGIDWASEEHALCVVDAAGRKLAGELFAHDEAGIRALVGRMRSLHVGRVAIERPDGLLVDRLLEAGFTVLPVHPNALKAASPTASMPSAWPSWRAPTPTGCGRLPPTATRPRRSRR
jgi:Transposase